MKIKSIQSILVLFLSLLIISCSTEKKESDQESVTEEGDSHARDYIGGEGEEDATMLGIDETYNVTKNGVNLELSYDAELSKFIGTLINTSDQTLDRVRVEIHLSNGKELGPTKAVSLSPDESIIVEQDATGEEFESWNAHAEVGSGEHEGENKEGHDEEGGEHDGEESEHS